AGVERLGPEDAESLGFPPLELRMEVYGRCWTQEVYARFRQFYESKGFDTNTQDLARRLGYPLYEVCCGQD
ncbi:hypothetical protein C8J57DRAFT_1027940, partial [Mycena rebaudengoi]